VPWHHFTLTPINLLMFPQVQSQLWLDCGWIVGNPEVSPRYFRIAGNTPTTKAAEVSPQKRGDS
jgi:hypothetical protein